MCLFPISFPSLGTRYLPLAKIGAGEIFGCSRAWFCLCLLRAFPQVLLGVFFSRLLKQIPAKCWKKRDSFLTLDRNPELPDCAGPFFWVRILVTKIFHSKVTRTLKNILQGNNLFSTKSYCKATSKNIYQLLKPTHFQPLKKTQKDQRPSATSGPRAEGSMESIGPLLERLKPFAWYWCELLGPGGS